MRKTQVRRKEITIMPVQDHGYPYTCLSCGKVFFRKYSSVPKSEEFYKYCSATKCTQVRKRIEHPPKEKFESICANTLYPGYTIRSRYINRQQQTALYTLVHDVTKKKINITVARYVMQEHLGRLLVHGEKVLHKDGDAFNNDISNLVLRSPMYNHYIKNNFPDPLPV